MIFAQKVEIEYCSKQLLHWYNYINTSVKEGSRTLVATIQE